MNKDLTINPNHIINHNVTLDSCIDNVKQRILDRSEKDSWNQGYTQALLDIHNLLTGTETWL